MDGGRGLWGVTKIFWSFHYNFPLQIFLSYENIRFLWGSEYFGSDFPSRKYNITGKYCFKPPIKYENVFTFLDINKICPHIKRPLICLVRKRIIRAKNKSINLSDFGEIYLFILYKENEYLTFGSF